jgi:uncharacterized protein with HEPN domain
MSSRPVVVLVDVDLVWEIVKQELLPLHATLTALLARLRA